MIMYAVYDTLTLAHTSEAVGNVVTPWTEKLPHRRQLLMSATFGGSVAHDRSDGGSKGGGSIS